MTNDDALHARCSSVLCKWVISFNPHNNLMREALLSLFFTDDETGTQRCLETSSTGKSATELEFGHKFSQFKGSCSEPPYCMALYVYKCISIWFISVIHSKHIKPSLLWKSQSDIGTTEIQSCNQRGSPNSLHPFFLKKKLRYHWYITLLASGIHHNDLVFAYTMKCTSWSLHAFFQTLGRNFLDHRCVP